MHSVCAQLRMGAQAPSRALTLHLPAPVAAPPPAPGCWQPPPHQGSCLAAPWGGAPGVVAQGGAQADALLEG